MQNDYHHHHPSPLRIKIIGKTIIKFIIFLFTFRIPISKHFFNRHWRQFFLVRAVILQLPSVEQRKFY